KRFKENLAFRPTHHSENRYPPKLLSTSPHADNSPLQP
ncbi:hypothetical protein ACN42_g11974, partial [Penicillium freii]